MKHLLLTLIVWILCFAAISVGASYTYDWYVQRGPEISIVFQNSRGLIPNQSKIMYRGVQVGIITDIWLDRENDGVKVIARVTKQSAALMGADTKFWIVKPEFGLDKISNLSAIATGNYIEMDPAKGDFVNEFIGLKQPPADHPRLATGLRLTLKAAHLGGVNFESPILYRGFQVGNVWDIALAKDKQNVDLTVYVYEEYRDIVRRNSYFSNISGVHANIQLFGTSQISMDSLSTLVHGGIAITTPNMSGPLAKEGDAFRLLTSDQAAALESK